MTGGQLVTVGHNSACDWLREPVVQQVLLDHFDFVGKKVEWEKIIGPHNSQQRLRYAHVTSVQADVLYQ